MKRIFNRSIWVVLAMFALSLFVANLGQAKVTEVDLSSAVGIWLFDEGAGDSAKDTSSKGNHAKLTKGPKWVSGKFGKALSLDGKDDYVVVSPSKSLESSDEKYTGTAWVKLHKPGKQRNNCCFDDQFIVGWVPGWHNIINVFGAGRNNNWGKVEIGSNELNPRWSFSPKTVNDGKWHHLAFAYTGKKKILYIDGIADIDRAATGIFGVKGVEVTIGGAITERFAMGLIDDVGIFNVALSKADVKTVMDKGLGRSLGILPVTSKSRLTTVWARIRFH